MHTTDSRIRADWTLPAETSAPPPTVTPDTSTTAGKVAVMQHVATGGQMQMMTRGRGGTLDDDGWSESWTPPSNYNFNWERYDYRIAQPPVARTALQLAREFRTGIKTVDVTSPAGRLCALLSQIDNSIVVTIEHFKLPHYGATKPEDLQPGRYRLVRDDQ